MPSNPLRLVAVSDIHGNWDSLETIAAHHAPSAIIHTGNFGFWNLETVERAVDVGYLKQIVAFLHVLPKAKVIALNNFSTITNSHAALKSDPLSNGPQSLSVESDFRDALLNRDVISHMEKYISGEKQLPCPIYTIVGPLDDPVVVEKFISGELHIPNLHLVAHDKTYTLKLLDDGPVVHLYGLGGNVKVHSLFDNGCVDGSLCGKTGDLWITLAQVAELYLNHQKLDPGVLAVKIFMSHSPVIKTPLLEHLAILTGADITVSQGLHFKYPVLGNGMSFVDSMGGSAGYIENYRSKFSRLRMILGELWLVIKNDVSRILADNAEMSNLIELGLSLFDKIPVTVGDSTEKIVRLTLSNTDEEDVDDMEISKLSLKKINDMYFSAYYNLWHFNLCDHLITSDHDGGDQIIDPSDYNVMVFGLNQRGDFRLEHCNSQGFNFKLANTPAAPGLYAESVENGSDESSRRLDDTLSADDSFNSINAGQDLSHSDDSVKKTKEILNSTYNRPRGRGRGRSRGGRGGKRGRSSR